jgi:hypothetical protein
MSEAMRFSRSTQCDGKQGYASRHVARKVARRSETKLGGGRLTPYRCEWCRDPVSGQRWWHLGHRPHPDAVATAREAMEAQDPYVVLPLSALTDLIRRREA